MLKPRCACGCGQRAANKHHAVYQQALREVAQLREPGRIREQARARVRRELLKDARNLVPVAFDCHQAHHGRSKVLQLAVLPDSVFEFAGEVLGASGYDYLRRRYAGEDARLEALLEVAA